MQTLGGIVEALMHRVGGFVEKTTIRYAFDDELDIVVVGVVF